MRALLISLLFASVLSCLPGFDGTAAAEVEKIPDSYAKAAQRISIAEGRVLNLRCSGSGERVVILEAGANTNSTTWYRVQPLLEKRTRVCAYDRAGYGYSDEGPKPRDLDADVDDLHALIGAVKISVPVVLVGHSLGSNIVRRYAQRFPSEVAGLVLVDPPEQGADDAMPERWKQEDAAMRIRRNALLDDCAKAAESGQLNVLNKATQNCLRAPPTWMGMRVAAAIRSRKEKPGYWRTLRSELEENQRIFSKPVPATEHCGALPLLLLSAGKPYLDVPADVLRALLLARRHTHNQILATSTRSKEIPVPDATHDIPLDKPEAIAAAVADVMAMAAATPQSH